MLGLEEREEEEDRGRGRSGSLAEEMANDELSSAFGLGDGRAVKVSAQVFLLCALLHLLGCLLHTGALAVLPVWFVLQSARGGLQKSSSDCALVFSAAALLVFLARSALGARVGEVVRLSPVRAARMSSGVVLVACLAFPLVALRTDAASSLPASALALALPVLLLAALLCATYVYRRASSSLLFVCLSASFTSPSTIVHFVGGLSDIAVRPPPVSLVRLTHVKGPFIMSMVMASVFRLGARYPVDASFFLFLMACSSGLLYSSTLLLEVQFRGDYGLVSEGALVRGRRRPSLTHPQQHPAMKALTALLRVPMEDLAYLVAPSTALALGVRAPPKLDLEKGI